MKDSRFLLLNLMAIALLLYACQKEEYRPSHDSQYAVYTILDPQIPIELLVWETTPINENAPQSSSRIVEIFEDDNLIFSDSSGMTTIRTGINPKISATYRVRVHDKEGKKPSFASRLVSVYQPPQIVSYKVDDSVALILQSSDQTLQQIEIITDQTKNKSPYYAYEIVADSLPFVEESPINLTSGWFQRAGYTCPEIGESPFLDKNYRIINLTCFEEENRFSVESSNHRPGDIISVRFTLCNFDKYTMDFSRWLYQNSFLQEDASILQVISTKDNFSNGSGYDFSLNRSCKEFILDFN